MVLFITFDLWSVNGPTERNSIFLINKKKTQQLNMEFFLNNYFLKDNNNTSSNNESDLNFLFFNETTTNLTNFTTNHTTTSTTLAGAPGLLIWSEVLYSCICCVGALTVTTNIAVFLNRQLKDPTYTFLLAEACVDLCYVSMLAFYLMFRCGLSQCEQRKLQLPYQIYVLVVANYLTSCMAINNIIIELFLSVQRLCIISNWSFLQNISAPRGVLVILTISAVYYSPVLFLNKISSQTNAQGSVVFSLPLTDFGSSELGRITPAILITIRLSLATVGLFSVNLFMFFKFHKHLEKKSRLKASKASSMTSTFYFIFFLFMFLF